jgi:hypothetical protein
VLRLSKHERIFSHDPSLFGAPVAEQDETTGIISAGRTLNW